VCRVAANPRGAAISAAKKRAGGEPSDETAATSWEDERVPPSSGRKRVGQLAHTGRDRRPRSQVCFLREPGTTSACPVQSPVAVTLQRHAVAPDRLVDRSASREPSEARSRPANSRMARCRDGVRVTASGAIIRGPLSAASRVGRAARTARRGRESERPRRRARQRGVGTLRELGRRRRRPTGQDMRRKWPPVISKRIGNCAARRSLCVTTIRMFCCVPCRPSSSDATVDADT
jgi:hypothetical protein